MASRETHYSTAQSGPASGEFHTAAGSGGGGGGGAGSSGSSEQSVSLAPPAWATRVFGRTPAAAARLDEDDLPQRGSAELCDSDDVESLRQNSSVLVRSVAPPALLSDTAGTPLAQALHIVEPALRQPSPNSSPPRRGGGGAAPAAAPTSAAAPTLGAAAPTSAEAAGLPAWEFPRFGGLPQPAAAAPTWAPVFQQQPAPALAYQQPVWQPPPFATPPPQQRRLSMQDPPAQQQQQQHYAPEQPLPAEQQPLPPGRFGWQRNPLLPEAPLPSCGSGTTVGGDARALPPAAPSLHASRDSWLSSLPADSQPEAAAAVVAALGPQQQGRQQLPPPPPLFRPPSAASAVMHRGPGSQQHLLPAEAAIYSEAELAAGGAAGWSAARTAAAQDGYGGSGGSGGSDGYLPTTAKSSPSKSLDTSTAAFSVEAYAGAGAAAAAAAVGTQGAAGGSGSTQQPGVRPSRTAALRKRHAAQLRRQDRDQYGVPVASSSRPFSLWASPQTIGEACTGLGVYFASVKQFVVAALLLSLVAVYPLASNLSSQRWAASYLLVSDQEPVLSCSKGWDTSSWVTGSTAGSRCSSSRYSSSFDCPSLCTWTSARLLAPNSSSSSSAEAGDWAQCVGLPPPALPQNAAGTGFGASTSCLLHPPCSAGGSSDPTAPDGPCYCCDLQLDPSAVEGGGTGSAGAGTVPAAQLWVLLVGQAAFLVWVLFLTRSQLQAIHAADARVITASDYTVRLQGVPAGLSAAELQQWCSHYGSVVAAYHVPDVGDSIRVAHRMHALQIRRAESDAWLSSPSCCACSCWFSLWALGAASQRRLRAAEEDAARELRCYERQEARPTGAALAVFEYAEHAANCIEDHHRSAMRRTVDAVLCGATASAPRLASTRVRVDRAPEPSDILWQHTACTGSAALWRRLWSGVLTLLIVAAGAGVQYGLAMAGEEERKKKLSQLYQYNPTTTYAFDFSSWAAFTASALEVTKLNAISMLSGLAAVVVNWMVTVAARQLAVLERWHTRTASERWALLKLSVAYLVNSFVVPLLAAYFAGSSSSWYSRGGLMESAFYMQLANALLPPLAVLCDLQEFFYFQLLSRSAKTQAMMDRLLQPPPFLLAEQYASALTTLGVALCWMPVLPISPMLAALGLFLAYWADKVVALRRCAHPGNMRGKLVSSSDQLIRVLPLVQLLLMRFLFFVGEGAMVAVFWTGLAVWLLFAVAPLRSFLGLVPRRRSTVTGGLSYQEALGRGQRKGPDDHYEAELPPCCSPVYRRQVAAAFAPLPAPLPACEALLPRQRPCTGGQATRPPFRPDRSADRAVARAAASLRARQQAMMSVSVSMSGPGAAAAAAGLARNDSGGGGAGAWGGGSAGCVAAAAAAAGMAQQQRVPAPPAVPGASLPPVPPVASAHHRRHQRQQSGASSGGGGGAGARLGRTISAVKDSLAQGASWLWNTPDPDDLFSYDWKKAQQDEDTRTAASAPQLPGQAGHSAGSGPGLGMA